MLASRAQSPAPVAAPSDVQRIAEAMFGKDAWLARQMQTADDLIEFIVERKRQEASAPTPEGEPCVCRCGTCGGALADFAVHSDHRVGCPVNREYRSPRVAEGTPAVREPSEAMNEAVERVRKDAEWLRHALQVSPPKSTFDRRLVAFLESVEALRSALNAGATQ